MMLLLTICLCFILSSCVCAGSGQIWGRPIGHEPFDIHPLREVQIPTWLQETTRFVHCIDSRDAYDGAERAGTEMTEVFFGDAHYAKYPSKLVPKDPDIPDDYMSKHLAQFTKRGMRILAVIWPCYQAAMYEKHPDWRRIATNTTEIPYVDMKTNQFGGQLCEMGPWGDFLIEMMAEIITMYPEVDGFCFDGLQHYGTCYCRHCREGYRKDTGRELPDLNMKDPEFRRYQLWADGKIENLVQRMQARIKGIRPDAVLVPWTTNSGRVMQLGWIPHPMSARMNALLDAPAMELWLDESHLGNTVAPAFTNAYLWSLSNHRVAFSEPYLMTHMNPYSTDSFPQHEELRRVLQVIAGGCRPNVALCWENHLESSLECVQEITRRSEWMTHTEPEPWAGIVMSDHTRTFYGREGVKVEERYLANVYGAYRASMEEHLATAVVTDWQLTSDDLSRYRVLVMPNTACLSKEQAEAIERYVKNGGGLVATVDTSLFDEMGSPRNDFALADVFGLHYQGVPSTNKENLGVPDAGFVKNIDSDYWEKRQIVGDVKMSEHELLRNKKLEQYNGKSSVVYRGQMVAVGSLSPDAKVIATLAVRTHDNQQLETVKPLPAVVVRSYGKGRVVHISAGFDSAYFLYPFVYQRLVLAQAMRWAAAKEQPISVEAPMCVQTNFVRQKKNGERLIVHLFNDLNTSGNHARPDNDVPQREETIPIHDIKIRFKGYDIERVHLEPEGSKLSAKRKGDTVEVTVPKLDVHSMVVAELKK